MAAYLSWAKGYYQGGSSEMLHIKLAVRPLKALYGRTNASAFGPLALKAVRERMIQEDLCRHLVNQRIGRIKRMFAWGVENELLPATVFHALQAVKGLRRGRSHARESEPVRCKGRRGWEKRIHRRLFSGHPALGKLVWPRR